jgi:hypothetical protein
MKRFRVGWFDTEIHCMMFAIINAETSKEAEQIIKKENPFAEDIYFHGYEEV